MGKVEIKSIDTQGRIILPKTWRKQLRTNTVVVIDDDDRLEILPGNPDLSRFVDSVETETEKFEDYHALRKGLRKHAVY